jgi:hypothetical protein
VGTTKVALSPAGDAHPTKTNTIGTLIFSPREREANWLAEIQCIVPYLIARTE